MSLISPYFDVKLIFFFPNFGQGPFPKIAGKGPDIYHEPLQSRTDKIKNKNVTESGVILLFTLKFFRLKRGN